MNWFYIHRLWCCKFKKSLFFVRGFRFLCHIDVSYVIGYYETD